MSSLFWVCLGVWAAINGFVTACLVRRSSRSQIMQSASLHVLHESNNTGFPSLGFRQLMPGGCSPAYVRKARLARADSAWRRTERSASFLFVLRYHSI